MSTDRIGVIINEFMDRLVDWALRTLEETVQDLSQKDRARLLRIIQEYREASNAYTNSTSKGKGEDDGQR